MSSQTKIKRNYDAAKMASAIEMVQGGMPKAKAARIFGVPRTTLIDKLSGRVPERLARSGPPPILTQGEEKTLVNYACLMAEIGYPLTRKELCFQAKRIIDVDGRKTPFKDNLPGRGWFDAFKARNPGFSVSTPATLGHQCSMISEEMIKGWFDGLRGYLTRKVQDQDNLVRDPTRIFNADESRFPICVKSNKVLAPKGVKYVYQVLPGDKTQITVMACFNAAGDYMPPLIVYPGQGSRDDIFTGFQEAIYCHTQSGWMDSELFTEFIRHFNTFIANKGIKKPVLLFVDGHSAHMSLETSRFCHENGIILYCKLENATHILQACENGLFSPMKAKWKENVEEWHTQNLGEVFTKKHFPEVFKSTWDSVCTLKNSISAFKRAGLFPLPQADMDMTKLDPSKLVIGEPSHLPSPSGPSQVLPSNSTTAEIPCTSTSSGIKPNSSAACPVSVPAPETTITCKAPIPVENASDEPQLEDLSNEEQYEHPDTQMASATDVKPLVELENVEQDTPMADFMDFKPLVEQDNVEQDTPMADLMDIKPLVGQNNIDQGESFEDILERTVDVKPLIEHSNEIQHDYEQLENNLETVVDVEPELEHISATDIKPPIEHSNEIQHVYEQRENNLETVVDVKPELEHSSVDHNVQRGEPMIDVKPVIDHIGKPADQRLEIGTDSMDVESLEISSKQNVGQSDQRSGRLTNFMYVKPTQNDQLLYCVECKKEYQEHCPVHGPLIVIQNMKVEVNDPDRALHSLPANLLVKESDIMEAGLGVFTDTEIQPGTTYGPYEGMYITDPELANASGYCWQVYKNGTSSHFVDAKDTACSNWMRYVNCALSESDQNLVAFQYKGEIYYRCIRTILPKTELLVWYGDDCARTLGIQPEKNTPSTSAEDGLDVQLKVNTRVESYQCKICYKTFEHQSLIDRHMLIHTEEHSYLCNKAYNHHFNFEPYMRVHTGEKLHKCDECNEVFSYKSSLFIHRRVHTGERPYKCEECDKVFSTKSNLNRHYIMAHTGERPYKCEECDKAFSIKSTLIAHKRAHTGEKPYRCETCDKAFSTKSNLIAHKRVHTGDKPYRCEECYKAFSTTSELTIHRRVHTGEKPYICKECDKAFISSSELTIHRRVHTGEKPYICEECDKAFSSSSDLSKHRRVHTGEKPYICEECDKAFRIKSSLVTHRRVHTGERPYTCEECDKAFSTKSYLTTHRRIHTRETLHM